MKLHREILVAAGAIAVTAALSLLLPHRGVAQYATPVNVMNSTAAPGNVKSQDNSAIQPFSFWESVINQPPGFTLISLPTVPSGKRLVIDYVSAQTYTESNSNVVNGNEIEIDIPTVNGLGLPTPYFVPISPLAGTVVLFQGATGLYGAVGSQSVHIVADPSTAVRCYLRFTQTSGSVSGLADGTLSVSGHFVNIP